MFSRIGQLFIRLLGGTRNERLVRARLAAVRERINLAETALQHEYLGLVERAAGAPAEVEAFTRAAESLQVVPLETRAWLSGKTDALRARLAGGATPEDILPEAFAAIRMASWLARDHRQFDVQLVAGQVLHEGSIAEEATGEGKTIACYPAIYLAVLGGLKVHVVTVNDYLVQRDRDFAAPVFALLGLRVGAIQQPMRPQDRKPQYACEVIYGTNSEFGFDYLRDNIRMSVAEQVQGPQHYAIVDEVDSILIDEARTPLIISGPAFGNLDRYRKADTVGRELVRRHRPYAAADARVDAAKRMVKALEGETGKVDSAGREALQQRLAGARRDLSAAEEQRDALVKYYEVELDRKSVHLTHEGVTAAQDIAGVGSFYVGNNMEWPHLLDQALRAHVVYERDKDYVVQNGEVIIVDEFTGRLMEGRQWSDGLHQAVEAKEAVRIKEENQTIATITYQNLFRLYRRLAGMTGTAMTEAEEFMKIYKLDVVNIPTHRPVNRVDHDDRIYGSVEEKWDALVEEINHYSKLGRPVLVGTTSIEKSEKLSDLLTRRHGIAHQVLNARPENAAREADIVAQAGRRRPLKAGGKEMVGTVTIATNMAGRGTDIKLGPGVVYAPCKVPPPERLAELGAEVQDLYPPGTTKCCIHCAEFNPRTQCAHCFKPRVDAEFPRRGRTACRQEVPCGLHIVGTERHESRRIDNQLRGRSGRQGDPGSSRFFLSLRDDLLAIFAGEFTVKVLGRMGLTNGQSIESRWLSKGIENAQKKVEQRNFDIRKNLLEYDEVMDQQRRVFYGKRQQILEGRNIAPMVDEMIEGALADAVGNYLGGDYVQRCVAEWARSRLDIAVPADQIRGQTPEEAPLIEAGLRARAREDAAATIGITLGEYVDPDLEMREWDLKGLSSWAMSKYRVNLSQNQLRAMSPEEMGAALTAAAQEHIDAVDLAPLGRFLEPGYAARALAEWARAKFGFAVPPEQLRGDDPEQAQRILRDRVDQMYRRRVIEYPVEWAIDVTVGASGVENVYARKSLAEWANRKYGADLTAEALDGRSPEELRAELVALAEGFVEGGLERTVEGFLSQARIGAEIVDADSPQASAVLDFLRERFDTAMTPADLGAGPVRELLLEAGRRFCRRELTELERAVLLQIYDASWKDHLLAMDHLKAGVGFRAHGEQDPKLIYKKEGFRQFQEMVSSVREKVTDIIFKARLGGSAEVQSVYQVSSMVHEQLSGYDHLAQDMAAQQAAGAPQVVAPIVREAPKVGRNDPCPCGSGKKFKKCCGKGL